MTFQVAERLYCIYYLLRLSGTEADRMRAFVRFMVPLYGEDRLARSLAEAACASEVRDRARFIEGYRELLSEDLAGEMRQRILEATPATFLQLPEARDFLSASVAEADTLAEGDLGTAEIPAVPDERVRGAAELLRQALEAGERALALAPEDLEYRHTLGSVYGLAGRWHEAFEQIALLVDDQTFVEEHLDYMLSLLIEAAADGQAERALRALSGTAAERAMEPLVVALKELAGEPYRAPQEVEEVKKDVLARIEARRRTVAEQRIRLGIGSPEPQGVS